MAFVTFIGEEPRALLLRLAWLCAAAYMLAMGQIPTVGQSQAAHPLDPLTREEISTAVRVLRAGGKVSEGTRFPLIALHEPPKAEVLQFRPGGDVRREVFAVVFERATGKTFEAVVDVKASRLVSWREVPGVQPPMLREETLEAAQIVKADRRWQQAIRKRGIIDLEAVHLDLWPAGYFGIAEEEGRRIARAVAYHKGSATNVYARPIEGVVADVDLRARQVLRLVDTGVVPVPTATADFDRGAIGKVRLAPKPLRITQPQGWSFTANGNEIRWQNWRFRFGLHPREGLVLYTVGYEDEGKLRSVLYRASLSEMVVPYGDPSPAWFFRNTFDTGEVGLGRTAGSLEALTDAPENAVFFDGLMADEGGAPYRLPRAVALFERDGGILWKHRNSTSGANETRRARECVLSFVATVGNYDYGLNWVFHQDGTLELEALMTGIMQTNAVEATGAPDAAAHAEGIYGHLVAPGLAAVHHQHFFNFRLDLDVDGAGGNSLLELNTEAAPAGPENAQRSAFTMTETPLRTEQAAQRQVSLAHSRRWKVVNPSVRNSLGQPVGYLLAPGENAVPYAAPESWIRKRAGFLNAHLWATPYDPAQRYAAGDYPAQSRASEGLPQWVHANRPIENQDIVLWYTMGITHIPRPEEWPVMPVHRAGFRLLPCGFFVRNPALDVPRPQ